MQALTLQRTWGSGGATAAACAADAGTASEPGLFWFALVGPAVWLVVGLGLRPGTTIGAPILALDGAGAGFAAFAGIAGAGGLVDALTLVFATWAGGVLKPAWVSTMGGIGADIQSSPKSTLPSAIASTPP